METIYNTSRTELVSFSFNGGYDASDKPTIIARHKINLSDRYYGPQMVEYRYFKTLRGAQKWALSILA